MDFCIAYRDNLPTLQTTLSADGINSLDLTNSSGTNFIYSLKSRASQPQTGICTVIGNQTTGFVQYQFPQNLSGGVYYGNFRVTYSGQGTQITLPNSQSLLFVINPFPI